MRATARRTPPKAMAGDPVVVVVDYPAGWPSWDRKVTFAEADGTFTIEGLTAGESSVEVDDSDFSRP